MRWLGVALLASGCSFDLAPIELADYAGSMFDLSAPDFARRADMAHVDLGGIAVPSHVPPATVISGAMALSGVTQIDTDTLIVTGSSGPISIVGLGGSFALDPGTSYAVLSVGAFTVDQPVTVTGTHPLVVVASGDVLVQALINGSAALTQPGPGGSQSGGGPGDGQTGANDSGTDGDGGGGGGGYGFVGGKGGSGSGNGTGGDGGAFWGALVSNFAGGSGGANGSSSGGCANGLGTGGAGGGAIQLFSTVSVVVAASGGVTVGGGGGRAGCGSVASAGGGGGSGGEIFLEAPDVQVAGTLAANGGGGGGGGVGATFGSGTDGNDGSDGKPASAVAPGGPAVGGGDGGGNGGYAGIAAAPGGSGNTNGGGGGGAAGRIWLRSRFIAPTVTGTVSPSVSIDTTL